MRSQEFSPSLPEYDSLISWNDNMVFVSTGSGLMPIETRIVKQDGKYIFNNAKIYKMDGTLVKDFPQIEDFDLLYQTEEVFESSVRQNVGRVSWIDDDNFVVNTQSRIFWYRVSEDRFELLDDMTKEVAGGWSFYMANSFGSRADWVDNGHYYYTACRSLNDKQQEQLVLYTADLNNGVRPVLGADWYYDSYKIRDGILVMQNNWYGDASEMPVPYRDLFPMSGSSVWYVPLESNAWPTSLGDIFCDDAWILNDSRYLAYHENRIIGEEVERVFHCYDTETGKDVIFSPQKYESAPLTYGPWSYTFINFRVIDWSVQFFYYTIDLQGTKTLPDGTVTENWLTAYYLYDTATDTRTLLSDSWFLPDETSFSIHKTHFAEAESFESVRVRALEP